jgi:hypothetical protein
VLTAQCQLAHKFVNHYLLSTLLRRRAAMLEIPVQFFAISPDQVRRTSVADGFGAFFIAIRERMRRPAVWPAESTSRTSAPR